MTTVLVIDDDYLVRSMVANILARIGVDVLEANNGTEGLETAHRERPALRA